MDYSPHGSYVRGILQARILEWVTIPGDLPDPGIKLRSPALQADSLPSEPPGKPMCIHKKEYLVIQRNKVLIYMTTQTNLEMMPCEIN